MAQDWNLACSNEATSCSERESILVRSNGECGLHPQVNPIVDKGLRLDFFFFNHSNTECFILKKSVMIPWYCLFLHFFYNWSARLYSMSPGFFPISVSMSSTFLYDIPFHRKLKQLFFFNLGRLIFLCSYSFWRRSNYFLSSWKVTVLTRAESIFFYLCSFPRCVFFHVYTLMKNGTFNHCGRSKDSNKWAKNETDMYMIMHMFNF